VEPGFSVLRACCKAYSVASARFPSLSRGVLSPFCGRYASCPARATPQSASVASSSRWRPVSLAVFGASLAGRGHLAPHVAAGAVFVPGAICPASLLAPRAPGGLCAAGRLFRGALGVANLHAEVSCLALLVRQGVKLLPGIARAPSAHGHLAKSRLSHGFVTVLIAKKTSLRVLTCRANHLISRM